jgi:uncharacterized protein
MVRRSKDTSSLRIFSFSAVMTVLVLGLVLFGLGTEALMAALVLVIIETAFSFDNAIINAKILGRLSKTWQNIFLSVGIIIAVFGMRVVFPIVLVMLTAGLSWSSVLDLALHNPHEYAHHLEAAHPTISAYGGGFLLMLAFYFFLDKEKEVHWLVWLEKPFQKLSSPVTAPLLALAVIGIFALLPANHHPMTTLKAGALGVLTYIVLHAVTLLIERSRKEPADTKSGMSVKPLVGMAAFTTFIYLEFLDASFSFDGVIGAFAITSDVVLIAAGLGVGALWVRSLTVFMVRKGTLDQYKFLDHGAHYTVAVLALILFSSAFKELPEYVTGSLGLVFIVASIVASVKARKKELI